MSKGFDIIIGNPPYGRGMLKGHKDIFSQEYSIYDERMKGSSNSESFFVRKGYIPTVSKSSFGNASSFFVERGINLTKKGGKFAMILPNSITRTEEFESVRRFIINNTTIAKIVDEKDAFQGVTLEMVSIFTNKGQNDNKSVSILSKRDGKMKIIPRSSLTPFHFPLYYDDMFASVMDRFEGDKVRSRSGIDHRLIQHEGEKDISKYKNSDYKIPFLHSGKSVKRYHFDSRHFHYIKRENKEFEVFKEQMETSQIITTAISPYIRATIKPKGYVAGTNTQVIDIDQHLREKCGNYYVLAVLNSRFMQTLFHVHFQNKIRYTFKIQDYMVRRIPIPISPHPEVFDLLGKYLLFLQSENGDAEIISYLDENILDRLVWELYFHDVRSDDESYSDPKKLLSSKVKPHLRPIPYEKWFRLHHEHLVDPNSQKDLTDHKKKIEEIIQKTYQLLKEAFNDQSSSSSD